MSKMEELSLAEQATEAESPLQLIDGTALEASLPRTLPPKPDLQGASEAKHTSPRIDVFGIAEKMIWTCAGLVVVLLLVYFAYSLVQGALSVLANVL